MFTNQLKKQMHNAGASIRQAFRAVLNRNNSASKTQLSQVSGLADETVSDIELMQHFGFTSNPPAGTDVVVVPLGGKTSHGVIVATEHGSYRIKSLPSGAVALYAQDGTRVVLNNDNTIDHYAAKTTFHGDVHIKGKTTTDSDIETTGAITSDGDQIAGNVSQINHDHDGVEAGNSTTGKPNAQ